MQRDSPQERFEALLEQHRKVVFKVSAMYCAHAEDRRDLAQEIRVQLWSAFPRYDASRPFATWMYRVALNVAISFARKTSVRGRHVESMTYDLADPIDERDGGGDGDERLLALQGFIEKLDALHRALLLLYLEEQSYREIAEVLGLSETNVATKLHRLKQRIQRDVRCAEYR